MHEVHGSSPEIMHILSKYFVRAYTRIYRHMTVYTFIYRHMTVYASLRIVIPGIYKVDRVYDGSFSVYDGSSRGDVAWRVITNFI